MFQLSFIWQWAAAWTIIELYKQCIIIYTHNVQFEVI